MGLNSTRSSTSGVRTSAASSSGIVAWVRFLPVTLRGKNLSWPFNPETLIADGKAPGRNPPVPVASSLSNASRESGHLAEAVRNRNEHPPDEDEGLEYVTPEPAPQQNQHTSTVPSRPFAFCHAVWLALLTAAIARCKSGSHKRTSGC